MQGTNAHLLVRGGRVPGAVGTLGGDRAAGAPAAAAVATELTFHKQHHWLQPTPHAMVHAVAVAAGPRAGGLSAVTTFECRISFTAGLAYLWDHRHAWRLDLRAGLVDCHRVPGYLHAGIAKYSMPMPVVGLHNTHQHEA